MKYEFNTVDEQGNKIMDKMSREETLQAMKTISAQYGDKVIVEFSGDGLAALVEREEEQAFLDAMESIAKLAAAGSSDASGNMDQVGTFRKTLVVGRIMLC